jgi:hypothetical protein
VLNATQYTTAISTAFNTQKSTTTAINTSSATAYVTVVDTDTIFDTVVDTVLQTQPVCAPEPPPAPAPSPPLVLPTMATYIAQDNSTNKFTIGIGEIQDGVWTELDKITYDSFGINSPPYKNMVSFKDNILFAVIPFDNVTPPATPLESGLVALKLESGTLTQLHKWQVDGLANYHEYQSVTVMPNGTVIVTGKNATPHVIDGLGLSVTENTYVKAFSYSESTGFTELGSFEFPDSHRRLAFMYNNYIMLFRYRGSLSRLQACSFDGSSFITGAISPTMPENVSFATDGTTIFTSRKNSYTFNGTSFVQTQTMNSYISGGTRSLEIEGDYLYSIGDTEIVVLDKTYNVLASLALSPYHLQHMGGSVDNKYVYIPTDSNPGYSADASGIYLWDGASTITKQTTFQVNTGPPATTITFIKIN